MEAEIALGGGTVEKFIGDAVVAVFGASAAQEDHAERALQTALWMLERLRELFGDRLALRIGVNSGEVVVGRPRDGSSFATGDAVNVAARLEQAAAPGPGARRRAHRRARRRRLRAREPRTVEAKGKEGGVAARELAPHDRADAARAAATAWRAHSSAASANSPGCSQMASDRSEPRFAPARRRARNSARRRSSGSSGARLPAGRPSGSATASRTAAAYVQPACRRTQAGAAACETEDIGA